MMRASICLLAMVVLISGVAQAQNLDENKLLVLMPELRTMPGPEWLQEGTRVTYFLASATVPADRFYYWKDYKGSWHKEDQVGPSGAGFLQYQCVMRSDTGAVGVLDNYLQQVGTGVLAPSTLGGTVDPAGAGACWANPAALVKADRFQSNDIAVIKMPQPIGDQVYKGIRFHYVGETAVTDSVYDLDSGLLLFFQHVALSADRRSTVLTQMTFVARRQVPPLVANAAAPAWMADTHQLQYQGAVTVHLQGSPQFPLPMMVSLQKTGGGARWAKYQATREVQGQLPASVDIYCGAGGLGGQPWMSPDLLAKMSAGQVLDEDPNIGTQTRVDEITRGPGGGDAVVITQEGKGFKRSAAYDRASGKVLMIDALQQVGAAVQETRLQLAR